mmetsp:Transcript_45944/g.74710  ORF Transcript_45944/g.74710 Transcript_45944/m.74710 type:complete len:262 (+) Transcript_45944:183-968(+)
MPTCEASSLAQDKQQRQQQTTTTTTTTDFSTSEVHPRGLRVAQRLKVLLAGELNHARRPTHEDEGVFRWRRHDLLDHLGGDETSLSLPASWWEVQGVVELESAFAIPCKGIQDIFTKNVVLRFVGQDQIKVGLVIAISKRSLDNLKHGCESCATSKHRNVLHADRLARQLEHSPAQVLVHTYWAHHFDPVAYHHSVKVEAHLATILPSHLLAIRHLVCAGTVDLDHQVNEARQLVAADGCVLAINLCPSLVRVRLPIPRAL